MPNIEALRRTLEHIKAHPGEWDQNRWSTCFAGWTLRLDNPAIVAESVELEGEGCDCCPPLVELYEDERCLPGHEVEERARQALALPFERAGELFAPLNTLEDLERIVGELTAAEATGEETQARV